MREGITVGAARSLRHGIRSASVRTGVKDVGSSSVLVMLFKRDPLVCKGFSERCPQNAPAA